MKVAIIGASGFIGSALLDEALNRGHEVTAIVRHPEKIKLDNPNLTVKKGDITNEAELAEVLKGNDAVICSYKTDNKVDAAKSTYALINACKKDGIKRLLLVNGAASLEVAPGKLLIDTPEFPDAWKNLALATKEALDILRGVNDLDWTALSPAAMIEPGPRTGKFRLGKEQLVINDKGESKITNADYAVAMIDELENPQHIKQRFTLAY
ncbi:NAD(P)-dependent oxidoreductase [Chitinophaga silvatica]|uniref:NAD(P)-dependent oxidoreductase n=1 Tax=Chitinophaga silvatica TaxID=2282649 RepID=A0A3E1Y6H1_9BACT|nr:NAD(P)-dependent oxidoreductase [Chitinophaga silvatica]RFS20544.1 NAD(P)-dependent oxidoreductase [Chitinophaga silvatica]